MSLQILGLGLSSPRCWASQDEAAQMALQLLDRTGEDGWQLEEIFQHAGIRKRHSVVLERSAGQAPRQKFFPGVVADEPSSRLGPSTAERMAAYQRHAIPLAVESAREAMVDAGISAERISHLITVTCTGFQSPGVDYALIEALELPRSVARTQIGFMGCHAAFNALRAADAFAAKGSAALVCAVELCSVHFDYSWDMERVVANALFADGSASAVGIAVDERRPPAWTLAASGSQLLANSADAMTWKIGDHGFQMTLSRRVPALIEQHLPVWLNGWLAAQGLTVGQVGSWAVHPGGPKILSSVEASLKLPPGALEVSWEILSEFGNMSSPTILFLIERLRRRRAPLPCVALGFGPGLSIEAMLFV